MSLLNTPPELLGRVLELTPDVNGRVAGTAHAMRARLGAMPRVPHHFHVFLDHDPAASDAERRESVLRALEAQARQFRLLSIEMPGFELGADGDTMLHPPQLAPGTVRLALVLRTCAALESLDLSDTGISTWRDLDLALPSCVALQRVNLSGCADLTRRENPFGGLSLCPLRELVLVDCMLGRNVELVRIVLVTCMALAKLDLSSNPGMCVGHTVFGAVFYALDHVGHALLHHPGLQHLELNNCNVHLDAVECLRGVLPTLPRLAHLGLGHNGMSWGTVQVLGTILQQCPALRKLDLRENPFGHPGLHELAASGVLRQLESLDVAGCFIDCRSATGGASFLAELPHCVRLAQLDLSRNDLGDTFGRALAGRLPAMAALTRLDLATTVLSDAGVRALARAVPRCPGLTRLNLRDNACTAATAALMREAWRSTHGSMAGLWMDA